MKTTVLVNTEMFLKSLSKEIIRAQQNIWITPPPSIQRSCYGPANQAFLKVRQGFDNVDQAFLKARQAFDNVDEDFNGAS